MSFTPEEMEVNRLFNLRIAADMEAAQGASPDAPKRRRRKVQPPQPEPPPVASGEIEPPKERRSRRPRRQVVSPGAWALLDLAAEKFSLAAMSHQPSAVRVAFEAVVAAVELVAPESEGR